jgi:hypothetical protein
VRQFVGIVEFGRLAAELYPLAPLPRLATPADKGYFVDKNSFVRYLIIIMTIARIAPTNVVRRDG